MDLKFSAVCAKAQDYGEYDKLVKLLTAQGVKTAFIKGVKKPVAKLKGASLPFAFYEYTAAKKGDFLIITNASQIEDLFKITADSDKFIAASIIVETALFSFNEDSAQSFIYLLRMLKEIIYSLNSPYIYAIKYLQYIIHSSGYGYEYEKYQGQINTPIQLLSYLWHDEDSLALKQTSEGLIVKTLNKIIQNFETKFECVFQSKKLLA